MKKVLIFPIIFSFFLTLAYGHSFTRITNGSHVTDQGYSQGINWVDYNNDGFDDLYVTNMNFHSPEVTNFLYLNNGNGTFTTVSDTISQFIAPCRGSSWFDFNEDGLLDCYIATWPAHEDYLFLQNPDHTFTQADEPLSPGLSVGSITPNWVDFDSDGDVDLFITNSSDTQAFPTYNAFRNTLYKNDYNMYYSASGSGLTSSAEHSYGSSWCDVDGDGDKDLFVANSEMELNKYYVNNGDGTFTSEVNAGITDTLSESFGVSWADYDNDGDFDLFVTNAKYNSNGKNFLYNNQGDGSFIRITEGQIVNDVDYSFGSCWGDYDNDGDLDLFVANIGDLSSPNPLQVVNNRLYQNNGDGTFTSVSNNEITDADGWSYGCGWSDYDNDGDLDLYVANYYQYTEENDLFENQGNMSSWIKIRLTGSGNNSSVLGTIIKCYATIGNQPVVQMREIRSESGYCSKNSDAVHFGLGDALIVDSLVIIWPSGQREVRNGVQVYAEYDISETGTANDDVSIYAVEMRNYPNPFNPETTIEFSLKKAYDVRLDIFNLKGQKVKTLVNRRCDNGIHRFKWNGKTEKGRDVGSGVYLYRLTLDGKTNMINRCILLK